MEKIEQLKQEASDLGIKFSPNIGEAKLAAKIEEFYVSQETSEEAVKAVEKKEEKKVVKPSGKLTMRERANAAEAIARVSRIVVITDNDQRENNLTTTVSVNCGNDWFDLGTMRIPLNTPVEVQQGFINVLKEITIPAHVRDPRNKETYVAKRARYSVSNEEDLRKDV
jgi:hypothetical protein